MKTCFPRNFAGFGVPLAIQKSRFPVSCFPVGPSDARCNSTTFMVGALVLVRPVMNRIGSLRFVAPIIPFFLEGSLFRAIFTPMILFKFYPLTAAHLLR